MITLCPAASLITLCAKTCTMNHYNFFYSKGLELSLGTQHLNVTCLFIAEEVTIQPYCLYSLRIVALFSLWNVASPTTKCYRLTFGIGLLLHTYYWCEPTEQWPTVPWVILLNKPYIAEQAIYCWAAHACTQCRRAPYRETVLGSGKRIAVLKLCRVWVNKLCSFNLLIEIGRKLHWNTCAAF